MTGPTFPDSDYWRAENWLAMGKDCRVALQTSTQLRLLNLSGTDRQAPTLLDNAIREMGAGGETVRVTFSTEPVP